MLTRLKIDGFKNLVDVDVRFGPFTCVAGANGTGKSNLFDAIHFLSALADRTLQDAAMSVRDEEGKSGDVHSLFHRVGDNTDERMTFEAEMIVPEAGADDLGQTARATTTFLRYRLELGYRADAGHFRPGSLEIIKEEMAHIRLRDVSKHILFPNVATTWRKDAIKGRRSVPYISTEGEGDSRKIRLHQDGGTGGRPQERAASNLPRTVLSAVNAAESPTVTLARLEMRSWRLLMLEPSSLRKPDNFTSPARLGPDGSNLPATLYHLAHATKMPHQAQPDPEGVYAKMANRLSELIDDVGQVEVERDDKRQSLTLIVTDRAGTPHPARALSDGTLRFLALAALEQDPQSTGILCLEEPENGIHPDRIPAMLDLLQAIATDSEMHLGPDNPLRQVIINTHSPVVVQWVTQDSLVVADLKEIERNGSVFNGAVFGCPSETWRANAPEKPRIVSRGELLALLNPPPRKSDEDFFSVRQDSGRLRKKQKTIIDRDDMKTLFPLPTD